MNAILKILLTLILLSSPLRALEADPDPVTLAPPPAPALPGTGPYPAPVPPEERWSRSHPRIFLTPARLKALGRSAGANSPWYQRTMENLGVLDDEWSMNRAQAFAILYRLDPAQNRALGAKAIAVAEIFLKDWEGRDFNPQAEPGDRSPSLDSHLGQMEDVALVFDWCHDLLSPPQRERFIRGLNNMALYWLRTPYNWGRKLHWHDYNVRTMYQVGLAGMVTYGENPRAKELILAAREEIFAQEIYPALKISGDGGVEPEGTGYGALVNLRHAQYISAVRDFCGEDLGRALPYYKDMLRAYVLAYHPLPRKEEYDDPFPDFYLSGDTHYRKGGDHVYMRRMLLTTAAYFADDPEGQMAFHFLYKSPPPFDRMPFPFSHFVDFLYHDPAQTMNPPNYRVHLATGTGTLLGRTDWTPQATHYAFFCGNHYEAHQDYDQNSFLIFKGGELAVDGGAYTWWGAPNQISYSKRTIAHNAILVYDKKEKFIKPINVDADWISNDGGQRTFHPLNSSPMTHQDFLKNYASYNVCTIRRFADGPSHTYALGDATRAYNSTRFALDGARAKVSNVTRSFLHIKPAGDKGDFFVVLDRVSSTDPAFPKTFLLHSIDEPQIAGARRDISPGEYEVASDKATLVHRGGALHMQTLLPQAMKLRVLGGKGKKQYWVDDPGQNIEADEYDHAFWRIEVKALAKEKDTVFLHMLHPTAKGRPQLAATAVEGDRMVGAQAGGWLILFARAEEQLTEGAVSLTGQGQTNIFVADLTPQATYLIQTPTGSLRGRANKNGVMTFSAALAGAVRVSFVRQ